MSPRTLYFTQVIKVLALLYGEPPAPKITDPFALIVWENIAYLARDERRAEAFEELRSKVGLHPGDILKARNTVLLKVTGKGIVPHLRYSLALRYYSSLRGTTG